MQNIYKPQLETIINQFKDELITLRASRAAPSLVENIIIDVYGSRMHLKELASISAPEPNIILIKPWDKNIIKDIEKGLIKSSFEFNPVVETELLRIALPELTQETRQKLVKKLRIALEDHRIKIRHIRDEAKKTIEKTESAGEITEDDKFMFIDKLNEMTHEYTDIIDKLGKKKEEEILLI